MSYFIQKEKPNKKLITMLSASLGISEDLAEVLVARGLNTPDEAKAFLFADIEKLTPVFAYRGMTEASDRIKQAIDRQETIVIYGDYDCDGVCATSILYMFLKSTGVNCYYYIPNRKREGYGINREALEEIADSYYPDLIITVDCGITSKVDIEYAMNDLGIDFIVTDHHEPPEDLPDCIVVDPKVDRNPETFNELCGAGIALRLCEAVGGKDVLMYYIDLCAIATIGDIVPLLEDNRIIVSYGLQIVNSRARLSTKLLLEVAGVKPETKVKSDDIAFKIVPRINAIGRLSDSTKAVEMLVDNDYFYVKSLAEQANNFNIDRQQFTNDLVADALTKLENFDLVNNRIIVLYSDKWEAGVLGIASAKITSIFHRPSILLTLDGEVYKGSARSVEGVNIYECVASCKTFLTAFGGHQMACGVTVPKENIQAFIFALNEYARGLDKSAFLPYEKYDLERDFSAMTFEDIAELDMLQPCGMANPLVKYKLTVENPKFSQITTTNHIKLKRDDSMELIYFNGYSNILNINSSNNVDILSSFGVEVYENRKYGQGIVENVQFDWNNFNFDEEYLAIKYMYLAKYDNESVFKVKYISQDEVLNEIENDLYGVCFLAFSKATFNSYKKLLGDKLLRCDYKNLSDINPYNRLVLDLDLKENLVYYKKIVILDTLPSLGIIDYIKLNMNAQVVMVDNNFVQNYKLLVKAKFPNVDEMRSIFVKFKNVLAKKNRINNFGVAFEEYAKEYEKNPIAFYIAMFVFYELKILKLDKQGFFIDFNVKTSLDNSQIYNRIKEKIYD